MFAPIASFVGVRWPGVGRASEGGRSEGRPAAHAFFVGQQPPTLEAGFGLPATVTAQTSSTGPSGKDGADDVQGALRSLRVKAAPSETATRPNTRPCGAFLFTPCMCGDGLQVDRYTVTTAVPSEASKAGSINVSPIRGLGLRLEDERSLSTASRGSRGSRSTPAPSAPNKPANNNSNNNNNNSSFAISDHSSADSYLQEGGGGNGHAGSQAAVRPQELLAEAILKGSLDDLKVAIEEAVRQGLTGKELRRARDAVLAIEATDLRKRLELSVDEAIESDDWWKLQASMQTIVGAGFGNSDMVTRLREAMKIHRKRREVVHALVRSAAARDATGLRTALEAALLSHAPEADVAAARCALRTLHQRTSIKEELRKLLGARNLSLSKLQEALAAARSCNFGEPPLPPLGLDPEEGPLLEELKGRIRERSLKDLDAVLALRDLEAAEKSLEHADQLCLGPDELQAIRDRMAGLRTVLGLSRTLQEALKDGSEHVLREAVAAVEAAGMAGRDVLEQEVELDASLKEVNEAILRIEEKMRRVSAAAGAMQELRAIIATDDARALSKALARADASGVHVNADVTRARERLRQLRTKDSAGQELEDAIRAANLYRLRAALPVAVAHGVAERDIKAGKEALAALEVQARQNRERETNGELHYSFKSRVGLPYEAPSSRKNNAASSENQRLQVVAKQERQRAAMEELRSALAQRRPDTNKLQSAAKAAADATAAVATLCPESRLQMAAAEREVEAAFERLRNLEQANKARQQLQAAVASADLLTLRTTLKQVQMGSEAVLKDSALQTELSRAKSELDSATARAAAREELRLARLAGSKSLLSSAVRAARKAGLAECEYEEDAAAVAADERGMRDNRRFSTPQKEALPTLLMSPFSKYQSPPSSFKDLSSRPSPASPEPCRKTPSTAVASPASSLQQRQQQKRSASPSASGRRGLGPDFASGSSSGSAQHQHQNQNQLPPAQQPPRSESPRRVRFCEDVSEIPEV